MAMIPPAQTPNTSEASLLTRLQIWLRIHQNIVFFTLLVIVLLLVLFFWRSYRINQMGEKAWYDLEKAPDSASLQQVLQMHGVTKVAPFIRLKLADAYFDEDKYPEARKEYEFILAKYPKHEVSARAKPRLEVLAINEQWQKAELNKRIKELMVRRNLPNVTIKTTAGEFEVELFEDDAPNTVANFISLAEKNAYNQTPFVEVKPDMGLCLGEKPVTPTHYIPFETNTLKHEEGSLVMLRGRDPDVKPDGIESGKYLNSATTRFYISLKSENTELDGKYTIFGRVTKGMDFVRQIQKGIQITQTVINYKRPREYTPDTLKYEPLPLPPPPPPPAPPALVTPTPPAPITPTEQVPTLPAPITPTSPATPK